MSAVFARESVVLDSDSLFLQGLSELIVRQIAGRVFIYAAGEYDGGLSSFEMLADRSIVTVDNVENSPVSGTDTVAGASLFTLAGKVFLLPADHYASGATSYQLLDDGTFGPALTSGRGVAVFSHFATSDSVTLPSGTYVYASRWGEPGLHWFRAGTNGSLVRKGSLADSKLGYLGDVTDIETAFLHRKHFLFTASGAESGVQSYRLHGDGGLSFIDRSAASEKWGFAAPTVLETAQIGGSAYLVMGAAESGTITVFSVGKRGYITPVDHLIDTRDTRFDGIQALTKFQAAGRVFLLAGGSDDGMTLLQLSPYGHLSVLATLADDWDTTLTDVTSIQVTRLFGTATVIAGSSAEHGFTTFTLDLGQLGSVLRGTKDANGLTGTVKDDDIYGNAGNDRLAGGGGNDRLCDGTGADQLTGGPGDDIFQFADDGITDRILDFEAGIDRIDLSEFALLYHFADLQIVTRDYGYDIRFGDDLFVVRLAAAASSEPFTFSQEDFIFG